MARSVRACLATFAFLAIACGSTVPLEVTSGGTAQAPADELGADPRIASRWVEESRVPPSDADGGPAVPPSHAAPTSTGDRAVPGPLPQDPGDARVPTDPATAPASEEGDSSPSSPEAPELPPIQIGTYYLEGGNEAMAGLGFSGLVIPDSKPVFDAFVEYVNERGGFGGRLIEPVYYKYQTGQDGRTQDAAACATFTEDNDVYLVVGGINSGAGQLLPCLADHDVPLIGANVIGDRRYFEEYHRYAYEPGGLNLTSGLELLVANLHEHGYLDGVDRIGLVQYPGAIYDHAVEDGLIPSLERVGLGLTERFTTSSDQDNGAIATSSANAVLKFRSRDIQLVLFVAPGGAAQTYFMQTAENQGYKPKYGIWSADSPYVLGITAPPEQLVGSIGVGYLPGLDVATDQDPTAQTPAGQACLELGRSMGLDDSGLGNPLIRAHCDVFFTLQRAMAAPSATTSTEALEQAINAIGSSHEPASTFAIRWVPASHDAAAGYRSLAYDTDCSCFTYVGDTQVIP